METNRKIHHDLLSNYMVIFTPQILIRVQTNLCNQKAWQELDIYIIIAFYGSEKYKFYFY